MKLVKIDVDKNPAYAGQLRVQSIPTVFAFVDGQPVDGFMGALPESQVKAFIDRLTGEPAAPSDRSTQLLAMAEESLALGDLGGAAQAFAQVLQLEPEQREGHRRHGPASTWPSATPSRPAEIIAMAPADAKDPDVDSVRAALALAAGAPVAETAELEATARRRPRRPRGPLRAGQGAGRGRATARRRSTTCSRSSPPTATGTTQAARKQLLTVFEAAGPTSESPATAAAACPPSCSA